MFAIEQGCIFLQFKYLHLCSGSVLEIVWLLIVPSFFIGFKHSNKRQTRQGSEQVYKSFDIVACTNTEIKFSFLYAGEQGY